MDHQDLPPSSTRLSWSRHLHPTFLIPILTGALVIGLLQVVLAVSFAALVFSGELSPFLARGLGFALFGSTIVGIAIALFSSLPGMIGGAQDISSAVLAVIGASIVAALGTAAAAETRFATVLAAVVLTSVGTGTFLLVLGHFRLGNLVRFLPHPVVGGFLAGTGWLLVTGSVGLMAGFAPNWGSLSALATPDTLALWLPGFAFAVLLMVIVANVDHVLVLPGMIVGALAVFYAITGLSGARLEDLGASGWLLGPFPTGGLWQYPTWREMQHVDVGTLAAHVPAIASIALVSAVAVLLNAGGLEVATNREVDLNVELRSAGVANLFAGAGGGLVGFQLLSLSLLGFRLGAAHRLVGLIGAGVTGAALLVGASFLGMVPTFALGGLLMFLGLGLLKEWVVDTWRRLPRSEYALVIGIFVTIAVAGFLTGVVMGLLAAVVLFTVAYGRLDVVRHERTGATVSSRVTRTPRERALLQRHEGALIALELQGFLFFGTSERLLQRVRGYLDEAMGSGLRYLILDFRRVAGSDSTAALSFLKMSQLAAARNVSLVFTDVSPPVMARLAGGGVTPDRGVEFVADLDRGVEHCEDDLLGYADSPPVDEAERTDESRVSMPGMPSWHALLPYFERRHLEASERLFEQGEPADHLVFVESGSLAVHFERADRAVVRLEEVGAGQVLGELGFFLREPRSASVVVTAPGVVHVLSRQTFEEMKRIDPKAALELQDGIVRLLSGRVRHLMKVVDILER